MAFKTKQDYYGLGGTGVVLVSTTENKTESVAEAQGEDGFVVASQTYGERMAPACDYIVTGTGILSAQLGSITTIDNDKFCLAEITITTAAGSAPTIAASGQQVEDTATGACKCNALSVSISKLHHAQDFGAFTLTTGFGAHLTQCTYTATANVSTADKDGVPLAHDVVDGRVTVTGTVQVSDSNYTLPTITPSTGWKLTSPLSETNPDADFPTYSFTLTKYLHAV